MNNSNENYIDDEKPNAFYHYYVCFGCGRRHSARTDAVYCCSVVQELYECARCSETFPSARAVLTHIHFDRTLLRSNESATEARNAG